MPTITVNRKVLEQIVGMPLPDEIIKDRVPMLGTALEGISGDDIEIEIFPNRPDMLSEQGLGRALAAFLGKKPGLRKYEVKPSGAQVIIDKEMKNVRPYTACAIVKGLKIDDKKIKELIDVQEKLHITFCRKRKKAAMGIYPIEKITLPIHFKCDVPEKIVFRPLEYPRELNTAQILKMHPTGREYAHLVSGMKKYAYFADANGQVLSFTPIINSHLTGKVTEETREVFIEVSGFDFSVCRMALNILVCAMADMGAKVYSMELIYPDKKVVTPDLEPQVIPVELAYINRKLGISLTEKQLGEVLARMGHDYKGKKVYAPAYRADILHPIDIVEDVSIGYGFENFEPEIPTKATVGEEDPFEKFSARVLDLLAGLGFVETSSYHISNKELQCKRMCADIRPIELANALTQEYDVLRAWMLPDMLQVFATNKHNEYPQNIFECGRVFSRNDDTETGVEERTKLCVAMCSKDVDYTRIRQVLDYMMRSLGLECAISEFEHPSFIPGRVGNAAVKGKEVGFIGEIHPTVLSGFSIEMPVAAFEIDLAEVYSSLGKSQLSSLDIRAGKITCVRVHPSSEKLYVFSVDLGTEKRQLVAGLRRYYPVSKELVGKNVLVVCNLKHERFKGEVSEGMLLTAEDGKDVELIAPEAKPGERMSDGKFATIDIDAFKNAGLSVDGNVVVCDGEAVKIGGKPVRTKIGKGIVS